jgi:hypothetical protein
MKANLQKRIFYFVLLFQGITLCFSSLVEGQSNPDQKRPLSDSLFKEVIELEKDQVINLANRFLLEKPRTIADSKCPRSQGGKHDYYSEGTYWWPDPAKPDGPYIRKDGHRNPENFQEHELSLHHFCRIVATQASAFLLTGDEKYANAAMVQMEAWFIDPTTRMNPNMLYAQAIKGICAGRGFGIIDAVPLIEVSLAVSILEKSPSISPAEILQIKDWFRQFTRWLTTHQYGIDEMNAANNHGTWWLAQVAAYARVTGNSAVTDQCRDLYAKKILPGQMAANGSFPLEIARTKPFAYSLYNLDAMAASALILSDESFDAWNYSLPDGRGIIKGVEFIMPFLKDIGEWPYQKDVENWESQPGPRIFILLAALQENRQDWLTLWKTLMEKNNTERRRIALPSNAPILWIQLINKNLKLMQ